MSLTVIEPTLDEFQQIQELKELGVLEDANNNDHQYKKFERPFETVVTYMCPDCQHADDKVGFYRNFKGQLVHDLSSLNGGACALPADSPLNPFGPSPLQIFCFAAKGAGRLKDTRETIVGSHAICGGASSAMMDIFQQVELTLVARRDVELGLLEIDGEWQVVPHYHVYYGHYKLCANNQPVRKTKRLNLNKWLAVRERYQSSIRRLQTRKLEDVLV